MRDDPRRLPAFMRTEGGSDFGGEEVMSRLDERHFRPLFRPFRGTEPAASHHERSTRARRRVRTLQYPRSVRGGSHYSTRNTDGAPSRPSTPSTRGEYSFEARPYSAHGYRRRLVQGWLQRPGLGVGDAGLEREPSVRRGGLVDPGCAFHGVHSIVSAEGLRETRFVERKAGGRVRCYS